MGSATVQPFWLDTLPARAHSYVFEGERLPLAAFLCFEASKSFEGERLPLVAFNASKNNNID